MDNLTAPNHDECHPDNVCRECWLTGEERCICQDPEEVTQEIPVETMAEVVREIGAAEIRRRMAERMGVRS